MARLRRNITAYKRATGKKFTAETELTNIGNTLLDLTEARVVGSKEFGSPELPRYYVHMSDAPREHTKQNLSLMRSYFRTPLGFYAYPLTTDTIKGVLSEQTAKLFGSERKYLHVLELTKPEQTLFVGAPKGERIYESSKPTLPSGFVNNASLWLQATALTKAVVEYGPKEGLKRRQKEDPAGVEALLAARATLAKWANNLRKKGWLAVFDPGRSIIHRAEPAQIVFFSTTAHKTVAVLNMSEVRNSFKLLFTTLSGANPLGDLAPLADLAQALTREDVFGSNLPPPIDIKNPGGPDALPVRVAPEVLQFLAGGALTKPDQILFVGFGTLSGVAFQDMKFREVEFGGSMEAVQFTECRFEDCAFTGSARLASADRKRALRSAALILAGCSFRDGAFLPSLLDPARNTGTRNCRFNSALVGLDESHVWITRGTVGLGGSIFERCDMTPTFLRRAPSDSRTADERFSLASGKSLLSFLENPEFRTSMHFFDNSYCFAPAGILGADGSVDAKLFNAGTSLPYVAGAEFDSWLENTIRPDRSSAKKKEYRLMQSLTEELIENLRFLHKGLDETKSAKLGSVGKKSVPVNWKRMKPSAYVNVFMNSSFRVLEIPWDAWLSYLRILVKYEPPTPANQGQSSDKKLRRLTSQYVSATAGKDIQEYEAYEEAVDAEKYRMRQFGA